jgi:uncharacterized NAD(P)/FAD-binding protein YdhS
MSEHQEKTVRIAIIGGGFSGLSTLLHLLQRTPIPLNIHLFEKNDNLCKGVAYNTESIAHPLNISANQMGALADSPNDFYVWLKDERINPHLQDLQISPESYLPRMLYGLYLEDLLHQGLEQSKLKKCVTEIVQDEVLNLQKKADGTFLVHTKQQKKWDVDYVVIAVGVPSSKTLTFETHELLRDGRYIHNLWDNQKSNLFRNFEQIRKNKNGKIVIIGSGLTSIDVLFELRAQKYQGMIQIISTSGKFPHVHSKESLPSLQDYQFESASGNILVYLKQVRSDWTKLKKADADWRQLMEALRPSTQGLWQSLPISGKRRFLQHLFTTWNRHRHRMSPQSVDILEGFFLEDRLDITSGRVENVKVENRKLRVHYYCKKTEKKRQMLADYVLNCSGPEYKLAKSDNALIQTLVENEIVLPDPLGLGLKIIRDEMLAGKNGGKIFALGALLFGERLETTSVPEIRNQADSIAKKILAIF